MEGVCALGWSPRLRILMCCCLAALCWNRGGEELEACADMQYLQKYEQTVGAHWGTVIWRVLTNYEDEFGHRDA